MANSGFTSVDDYIAAQPERSRAVLEQVRAAIRQALPDAAEVISYQIPTYKTAGGTAIFFAGWKNHYSLYPIGEKVLAAFGTELGGYRFSKGTMRLPLDQPVPSDLIVRIARFRASEVDAESRGKAAGKRK